MARVRTMLVGLLLLTVSVSALAGEAEPPAAESAGDTPLGSTVEDTIAREVCKGAAIRGGQVMGRDEMEALVRSLEQCASPRTCPHGRPTMIHLSVAQLAREFGR